ncbi:Myb/SANT-like DNA-binding domain-containing protein [Entamoeba marina]
MLFESALLLISYFLSVMSDILCLPHLHSYSTKSAFKRITLPHNYSIIPSHHLLHDSNFKQIKAFPSDPSYPTQITTYHDYINNNNYNINQDDTSSRAWTEKATKYVLLKYFYWKYTEPNNMSLHQMYKTIAASVALDMSISKTSTQIRDKINNIKSGFKKDYKPNGKIVLKHLSKGLYDVMKKYYDKNDLLHFSDIQKEISADIEMLLH